MYVLFLGGPKTESPYMRNQTKKPLLLAFLILIASVAGCIGNDDDDDKETLTIAFNLKDDYTNVDENPQRFADYLADTLDMNIELYPVDSEGAILQALRFGNADIAFMDGAAAWIGWQQYDLEALAADQKSDGRTYYDAHAVVLKESEMANASLDSNDLTDPFSLLEGKTSCHTGWLKSAGMLLPMGHLIGNGYADVIGDSDDIESVRSTILNFFSEDSSIPDSGTPYYSYSGALRCLSEGVGDVAFVKDSTVASYCANIDAQDNEDWCLDEEEYVLLPSYGQAPSHPVMYNPELLDSEKVTLIQDALVAMKNSSEGISILSSVLNTPSIVKTTAVEHLSSYGALVEDVPGIETYFGDKYGIEA